MKPSIRQSLVHLAHTKPELRGHLIPMLREAALSEDALSQVMAGLGMLMAQSVIVTNPMFDETEIRKYLRLRLEYHDTFVAAIGELIAAIEAGDFGEILKPVVIPLRAIAATPAKQAQRALRLTTRAFRGLKHLKMRDLPDSAMPIMRIIRMAERLDPSYQPKEYEYRRPQEEYENFLGGLLRVQAIPAPIRTIFRKAIKIVRNVPTDTANAGAWFEMSPETQAKFKARVEETKNLQTEAFDKYSGDPEQRQKVYQTIQRRMEKLVNAAGVNLDIIAKGAQEPQETLEKVLQRESRLQADGPTEYILVEIRRKLSEFRPLGQPKSKGTPRELGKVLTQISRARTFTTAKRIIQEAVNRKLLYPEYVQTFENLVARAGKNLALKRSGTLTPLQWAPIEVEDFQAKHTTGDVVFDPDMPEEARKEVLGRVSRALEDLEGVFGKGFAGKHDRPLTFEFTGATAFTKASYFAWDNPNDWRPRVRFGEEYEGLLAHELSHFFDDLLDTKLRRATDPTRPFRYTSGALFINTGVSLEHITSDENQMKRRWAALPELADFAKAVVETADYKRWKDMTSNAHWTAVGRAIKNLTGMERFDLPEDHPYRKLDYEMVQYRSEYPPELLAETERTYTQDIMGGDNRKLTYYHSGVEIWARMVEQYVYTKLAAAGIANPWLTQLTYDTDELPQMMKQETFEEVLVPILDRLFARIKEQSLVASRRAT